MQNLGRGAIADLAVVSASILSTDVLSKLATNDTIANIFVLLGYLGILFSVVRGTFWLYYKTKRYLGIHEDEHN